MSWITKGAKSVPKYTASHGPRFVATVRAASRAGNNGPMIGISVAADPADIHESKAVREDRPNKRRLNAR
jgi:hypothetical protein